MVNVICFLASFFLDGKLNCTCVSLKPKNGAKRFTLTHGKLSNTQQIKNPQKSK